MLSAGRRLDIASSCTTRTEITMYSLPKRKPLTEPEGMKYLIISVISSFSILQWKMQTWNLPALLLPDALNKVLFGNFTTFLLHTSLKMQLNQGHNGYINKTIFKFVFWVTECYLIVQSSDRARHTCLIIYQWRQTSPTNLACKDGENLASYRIRNMRFLQLAS